MRRSPTVKAPLAIAHVRDLVPDPENRRRHTPRNIGMIVDGLQRVGAARSIVIDEDGVILAGNGVTEAAAEAGITKVRVVDAKGDELIAVRRTGLTADQKRSLAMYDNRTAELAEWSGAQLQADHEAGLDLQPWFSPEELRRTLAIVDPDPGSGRAGDEDRPTPEPRATTIKPGDLFALGPHRLICGDATDPATINRLRIAGDGAPIDGLVTDPPYCSGGFQEAQRSAGSVGRRGDVSVKNDKLSTRGYLKMLDAVIDNVDARFCYVFTDWRMWTTLFDCCEHRGYGVRSMIVWNKGTAGMGRGWRSQHELVLFGARESPGWPESWPSEGNVIDCPRTGNVEHATEKPVALVARLLKNSPFLQTVADPFCGSGTTILAAAEAGIRCLAVELDPGYCQVAIDRWTAAGGQVEPITAG
jgi:DNA modification methylase